MNKKKKLKKLSNKINKTLGWYLRKPDTTLAGAERACLQLHQVIEKTYRNNFMDNGNPYFSKPIISESRCDVHEELR